MHKTWVVILIAVLVFAGAVAYHAENSPKLQSYSLDVHLLNNTTATDIGNISVGSYHYDIHYNWFNSTLSGYSNYTITFSFPVAYNGVSNETAHVYLDRNLTLTFDSNTTGSQSGAIYI